MEGELAAVAPGAPPPPIRVVVLDGGGVIRAAVRAALQAAPDLVGAGCHSPGYSA